MLKFFQSLTTTLGLFFFFFFKLQTKPSSCTKSAKPCLKTTVYEGFILKGFQSPET